MTSQIDQYVEYLYKIGILNGKMRQKFVEQLELNLNSAKFTTNNNNKTSSAADNLN